MKRWFHAPGRIIGLILVGTLAATTGCVPMSRHEGRVRGWREIPLAASSRVAREPRPVAFLDDIAADAAKKAVEQEGQGHIAPGDIHVTVIDCRDPHDPRMGSYRGDEEVYPASVIKLCYMVDTFDQNRIGLLKLDADVWKDLRLMIGPSDNHATNRILDRLTNTGFGGDLQGRAWDSFAHKRREPARYFQGLGLSGLWPTNHTFDDTIRLYGRDAQWLGPRTNDHYKQSNAMTTNDTARLLYLIWRHAVVDPDACHHMLKLMCRKPNPESAFFTSIIPKDATLYSKAGYTDLEHHDAGIFALDKKHAVIVVVFTVNHGVPSGKYLHVVPRAGKLVLDAVLTQPGILDATEAPPKR